MKNRRRGNVEGLKSGNERDQARAESKPSREWGFYGHDVQPTEGTELSGTIMNSPMAKRLKLQEL
jgi:hypothetical protein